MSTPGERLPRTRLSAFVRGRVQGVGFRWWVTSVALELGLDGFARNLPDGRVEVLAQGSREACEALLDRLAADDVPRRPGLVDGVTSSWLEPVDLPGGFTER